jgi:RNA polymerase sigma factor for flagellar operon FliA
MTSMVESPIDATNEHAAAEPIAAVASLPNQDMSRLVRAIAARVLGGIPKGSGIEMSDLIQAGNLGLMQAERAFNSLNGAPLAGYAKFRIRGEMLDTVRRNAGRGSARAERTMASAEAAGEDPGLENSLPAPPEESPLRQLVSRERAAILGQEVQRLPPRYRMVVRLRYSRELSLREIGVVLRVNESRACQLHRSALGRLRRALSSRGVKGFLHLM